MKLNKEQLKNLIKECLVELLTDNKVKLSETKNYERVNNDLPNKREMVIKLEEQRLQEYRKKLDNMKITNDPILSDILADTAKSVINEQSQPSLTNIPNIDNYYDQNSSNDPGIDLDIFKQISKNSKNVWKEIAGLK